MIQSSEVRRSRGDDFPWAIARDKEEYTRPRNHGGKVQI